MILTGKMYKSESKYFDSSISKIYLEIDKNWFMDNIIIKYEYATCFNCVRLNNQCLFLYDLQDKKFLCEKPQLQYFYNEIIQKND
ncbi:hypothetical protein M0R19_03800 [Candidatus Pacearchaeota archaeon]|jgi:hypothetical protein|nr:hypothetical protein [Candidatus Pacearchaeota archaeon]